MAVDTDARLIARDLISTFVGGKITNDEFTEKFPLASKDRALAAIYGRFWSFYSDNSSHYFDTAMLEKDKSARELVSRCLTFLQTQLEYRWRNLGIHSAFNPILWLHRRGRFSVPVANRLGLGDYAVWPFFNADELLTVTAFKS